jgi:fibronectin type 3 domain-containing protein
VGSIRRTPPRALHLAAMLAAAALSLPQIAGARVTSSSTTGSGSTLAPVALTAAKAITNTAPSLTWTVSAGAANYRVYRDGSQIAKVSSASYLDTGLTTSGSHQYVVRAATRTGSMSAPSPAVSVLYDISPPSLVVSVVAAASPTSSAPDLSWPTASDSGSGIAGYRLLRNGVAVADVSSTGYVDAAAPAGTSSYAVRSIDRAGNLSALSPVADVTVDRTPPGVPAVSAAQPVTASAPQLDWPAAADDGSGLDHYRVFRDGVAIASPVDSAYTDGSALADGVYIYTVTSVDAAGNESASSAPVAVSVDTTAPSVPASLSAASPTTSAPQLSWPAANDAGSGVAGYRVLREGVVIATVTATSYLDTSLTADGSYTYTVRAFDLAGNASGLSAARTVSYSQPAEPSSIYTGVSARLSTTSTATQDGNYPTIKLLSPFFRWSDLEPQIGTFSWAALDADIARARTSGNRLIVRISCGAQSPAWLYGSTSSGGRPVSSLDLISTDPNSISGEIQVPAPWDADLLFHYRGLIQALQNHLSQFGDSSQSWRLADYVYFVPVSMPTEVGSEMPLGYGQGTYTGVYKGRTGTWDVHDSNQAEWLAHGQGATAADKLDWLQAQIGQAWKNAVDVHMQLLTAAPSAVAYGGVLGDGMATARWIASNDVPRYPARLWSMTTNLQPDIRPDGSLGPYSDWSSAFSGVIKLALQNGGVVGFQAAGPKLLSDCNRMAYSLTDGIQNYQMRFYEAAPSQINQCSSLLLTGANSLQARLASTWGG